MSWLDYFFSRLILFISFLIAASLLGLGSGQVTTKAKNDQKETILSEINDQ